MTAINYQFRPNIETESNTDTTNEDEYMIDNEELSQIDQLEKDALSEIGINNKITQ